MANFRTHLIYGTVASGAGATLLLNSELVSPQEALLCWVAGTVGGLLPDVDSDNPQSAAIVFSLLGVVASALTVGATLSEWPLIWVWLAAAGMFAFIYYGVRYLFEAFTSHRGVFHSVLAGVMFGLLATAVAGFAGATSTASWFYGLFLFVGYVIHLLLDEAYAVNFANEAIKRPLGGTFKFFDYKNLKSSAGITVAVVALFFLFAPSHSEFVEILKDGDTYSDIMANISPVAK